VTRKKKESEKALESGPLERLFAGNATAKMLDFLSTFREFDYSESDIARYSGVSIRHAQREIPKLERLKLIKMTRISGKSKMYRMDAESQTAMMASKFGLALASVEVDNVLAKKQKEKPLAA
jgi:hypothetical protein